MIAYSKCVLLVCDPNQMRMPLRAILEHEGYIVVQVHDGTQALSEMHLHHFDAVVTDAFLPDCTARVLLDRAQSSWPEMPVILFSRADWDTCDLAEIQGGFAWIRKSAHPGILLSVLALATERGAERESVRAQEALSA